MLNIALNDLSKTWRADDISLVEAVAERAATAMHTARLFQTAHNYAGKDCLISEASTKKISGAHSIENTLRAAAQEAVERARGGSEVLSRFQSKGEA